MTKLRRNVVEESVDSKSEDLNTQTDLCSTCSDSYCKGVGESVCLSYKDARATDVEDCKCPEVKPIPVGEGAIMSDTVKDIREYNVGDSDYAKHKIQPWDIWLEYNLDPWEADIIKRVLRTKKIRGKSKKASRIEDFEKIIHVCQEKLRQLNL